MGDDRIENLELCTGQKDHLTHHKLIKWARKYEKCVVCSTIKYRHEAKGMCLKCYTYRRNHR